MPIWNDNSWDYGRAESAGNSESQAWERAGETWPDDADVQLLAAEYLAPTQRIGPSRALSLVEKRLQRAPNDLFWLCYYAHLAARTLDTGYGNGPMFNPNWPKKPDYAVRPSRGMPAQWQRLEVIAKRGAALEPNNSFWTWMRARARV